MNGKPKYSILIVDDEKSNLDVLNHILKQEYTIYIAKTGEAALKRAAEKIPDLILLDIIMPDMSGYEVLTELKSSKVTREIPVIFITGLDNVQDEEKGFRLGAADYIKKPFNNTIVQVRVKTHIQILKQIRTIEQIGLIDSLTEIANRRSFDNQLRAEWSRSIRDQIPVSLLMIDADNFKLYNDTYGHPQGDRLLQAMAKIFQTALKRSTDMAARLGGEEFAMILPNTDLGGALKIAEDIRISVENATVPDIRDSTPTSITVSIGIASTIPAPGDSVDDFILLADQALYAAKNNGRNQVSAPILV